MSATDFIESLKYCLELIEKKRQFYAALGYTGNELTIEKVLNDIENEIGCRAFKEWRWK